MRFQYNFFREVQNNVTNFYNNNACVSVSIDAFNIRYNVDYLLIDIDKLQR